MQFHTDGQDYSCVEDNMLINMYHENNQQAIAELIGRYKPLINKICSPYVAFLDSQDLSQEAYLGLLSAIMTYESTNKASFSTYANVCIKNKVKNFLISTQTKKSLFTKATLSLDELIDDNDRALDSLNQSDNNPEKIFIRREEYSFMINTIDSTLSILEKEILFLYMNGFSSKEICLRQGITQKKVDNTLNRAKVKLRKVFSN